MRSSELHTLLFDNLTEGVIVTDEAQRIIEANRAFLKSTGYEKSEVLGKTPKILRSGRHSAEFYRKMWESIRQTGRWEGEIWNRRKNGEVFPQEMTINRVFIEKEEAVYYVGLYRDISERKKMERQLTASNRIMSALIEHLQDGVLLVDAKRGTVRLMNSPFCRILKLGHPVERYIGTRVDDTVQREVRGIHGGVFPDFQGPHDTGEAVPERELSLRDGRLLRLRVEPIETDEHETLLFWRVTDITAQKRMETALIAAKEHAESANRYKSTFLSLMSHELRTPMNAILGFAQLMESDASSLPAEHRESVAEILNAGRHLIRLIDDILDLSKLDTGHFRISMEDTPVREIIRECMQMAQSTASRRHIRLIDRTGPLGNVHVQADPTRLKQVLLNLLTNAIKFNVEQGSVFLDGEICRKYVKITVQDTGIGIPKHEYRNIFEPFYRVAESSSLSEGTGIGLTLVRQLMQLMGGDCGVESVVGIGSRFWIRLKKTIK